MTDSIIDEFETGALTGAYAKPPRQARPTHCKRGHALEGDNVRHRVKVVKGKEYRVRACRQCHRMWNRGQI